MKQRDGAPPGRASERDRLGKVENLNSGGGAAPAMRWAATPKRRLAWSTKRVRDLLLGVAEICAVTPGRRRAPRLPRRPVPSVPVDASRRRPSRACSRGSCRRRSTITRAPRSFGSTIAPVDQTAVYSFVRNGTVGTFFYHVFPLTFCLGWRRFRGSVGSIRVEADR